MGSSGNLGLVNLNKYTFENIKEKVLEFILEHTTNTSYEDVNTWEEIYFTVAEINSLDKFLDYFRLKVVDYCPPENSIEINGKIYNNFAGDEFPQIIDEYLVIYETDQSWYLYNFLHDALMEYIDGWYEIWT